jgi:hypothetical protein
MRHANYISTPDQKFGPGSAIVRLAPLLVLLALTLFPFGWLGELWPAFGRGLDRVFSDDGRHAIGHAALFCLLGCATLLLLPRLRARPAMYLVMLMLVGVGQEFFQMLYKRQLLLFDDSRDLLTDLAGVAVAFALVWCWQKLHARVVP